MLFQKKERSEKSLYPVLHVAGSLQEYRQELVRGEVAALRELNRAAEAFREAQGEQERLQQSLRAFDQTFLEMRQMAIELAAVREEVSLSVAQARREMELLWGGAGRLEEDMDRLRGGAGALSRSVEQAGQDAGALSEAARQASELAVETALRAARSEEEGFAQGLSELEGLVKEAQRLSEIGRASCRERV